jgi:hypothetical protein
MQHLGGTKSGTGQTAKTAHWQQRQDAEAGNGSFAVYGVDSAPAGTWLAIAATVPG